MRRKDREITDYQKMLEVVAECDCCRLGLVDGDEAYIVPMNFGFSEEDGNLVLYFHTAKEGRKIDLLKKADIITFQMDTGHGLRPGENAGDYSYFYKCVMGRGKAEILSQTDDQIQGFHAIMAHYAPGKEFQYDMPCLDRVYVVKLTVTNWSCKVH